MSRGQIREAIYSVTCDYCGVEKIDPIGWIQFYVRTRIGLDMDTDMCEKCFDRLPVGMQNNLTQGKNK